MAYPGCQAGTPIPTTTVPADSKTPSTTVPATSLDYIAVRNLETGATQEAPYGEQGDATSGAGPVWSPDGTQLAVMSPHGTTTMILSAAHPTRQDAKAIQAPSRCTIGDIGAWTSAGITESLDCEAKVVGHYNPHNPPKQWNEPPWV
jgi:hypothetical protein